MDTTDGPTFKRSALVDAITQHGLEAAKLRAPFEVCLVRDEPKVVSHQIVTMDWDPLSSHLENAVWDLSTWLDRMARRAVADPAATIDGDHVARIADHTGGSRRIVVWRWTAEVGLAPVR